jgi:hypothetical protein
MSYRLCWYTRDGKMIVICGWYPVEDVHGLPTGDKELLVSHGLDPDTLAIIPLPNVSPQEMGCKYDLDIGEYVI